MSGWVQTVQRIGQSEYRKVMVHVTNPDHYEPTHTVSDRPPLKMAARYEKRKIDRNETAT